MSLSWAPDRRRLLRIGDVARRTGLTPRAIRHYESLGLLRPADRVEGANRLFDDHDIEVLLEIRRLRDVLGFSLAEIGEMLETDDLRQQIRVDLASTLEPAERRGLLAQARELAGRRLALIEAKLTKLTDLRDEEVARLSRLDQRLRELENSA